MASAHPALPLQARSVALAPQGPPRPVQALRKAVAALVTPLDQSLIRAAQPVSLALLAAPPGPVDPSRRKAYLKEARAFLRHTTKLHYSAVPWTTGFRPGRAPRLSPVDPVSLDMSGNGRLYRSSDIPPAALDISPPLRLGSFSWKRTDRPHGVLIAELSKSLRV
jgi:hypothetical protein